VQSNRYVQAALHFVFHEGWRRKRDVSILSSIALPDCSTEKAGSSDSAIDDTLLNTKRSQLSEQKVPVQDREFVEGNGTRV